MQVECDVFQLHVPGIDLREIQDVVQDGQQGLRRRSHQLGGAELFGSQFGVEEDLDHAEHSVHRRPDLMAHVGKERALRLRGAFGVGPGLLERFTG